MVIATQREHVARIPSIAAPADLYYVMHVDRRLQPALKTAVVA
jgi:hypothetical protein